jgi:serine/threonine protein kinase
MTAQPHPPNAFPAPPARPDVPGFTVSTLLGFGSHGEVWLAEDLVSGETVALKIGKPPGADPPGAGQVGDEDDPGSRPQPPGDPPPTDAAEALAREIALLSRIHDPHVVRFHRVVRLAGGGHALVLEHAAGGNLGSLVAARGALDPAEVTTVLVPLAQALDRLHARGLAHGDLSPGNVLFAHDGRPLLSDLGVSRLLGTSGPGPHGTPGFVDPAVSRGVDPRASDVWSLAALGWFALTGRPPGPANAVRPPASLAAPALTRLLSEVLGADPAERPPAAELAHRAWDAVRPIPIRLLLTSRTQPDDDAWASRTTRRAASGAAPGPPPATSGDRRVVRRHHVESRHAGPPAARSHRSGAGKRTRSGTSRRPALAMVIAALVAGGAAVTWAVDRASRASASETQLQTAAEPASGAQRAHQDLVRAVEDIGRARATAFAMASQSPLAQADERGSPAMAADARLVRELADRRWRLVGVRYTVTDVRVVQRSARAATVTARVTTSAHRRTTAGGALVRQVAADGPRPVTLTLVAVPDTGWRVRAVS